MNSERSTTSEANGKTSGPPLDLNKESQGFAVNGKLSVHKSQIGKHSIYIINSTSYKRMDKNAK